MRYYRLQQQHTKGHPMASTYDVIVDTPKYHRQGKVKLELSGDTACAHLDITDVGSLDAEGTRNGKDFDVAGVAHIDGEDIEFTAHGATWANSIDVKAQTSIGEVVIYGTMTGYSAGDVVGNDAGFAGRWADV
jgi:hypothetical protein